MLLADHSLPVVLPIVSTEGMIEGLRVTFDMCRDL